MDSQRMRAASLVVSQYWIVANEDGMDGMAGEEDTNMKQCPGGG